MIKRILLICVFIVVQTKLYADGGCSGPATFTATYDNTNCCYQFTNTTPYFECGAYFICTWDFGDGTPAYTAPQSVSTVCHHYANSGVYTVTLIFDMSGCAHAPSICNGSQQFTITLFSNAGPDTTICAGSSTTLSASGGALYAWAPAAGLSCTSCPNPVASPSTTTAYSVTITDPFGCSSLYDVNVNVITNWVVNAGPYQHICSGDSVPLNVSASGTINWSPSVGLSCTSCSNPRAKPTVTTTYTVSATNGICTSSDTVTVAVTTMGLASSVVDGYSCGGCAGVASVTASGGVGSYNYSWSNGPTSSAISSLCAGTYAITVSDVNNCTASRAFTITQPIALAATETHTNLLCNGDSNGSASISSIGGTPPYSYLWSNGATTSSLSGLYAGTYFVTVSDTTGCQYVRPVTIAQPSPLLLTATAISSCSGPNNGQALVTITGGNPSFSYAWSNGGTTSSISGLSGGTYTVTVTDANNCVKTASAVVGVAPVVTAGSSSTICNGQSTTLTASGGISYVWTPPSSLSSAIGSSVTAYPTSTTTYTVTGTATGGCTNTAVVTVTVNPRPVITIAPVSVQICPGSAVNLTSNGANSYTWGPATGLSTTSGAIVIAAPTGTTSYTVTGTDGNGCTNTASRLVIVKTAPDFSFNPLAICIGSTTKMSLAYSNSSSILYTWGPPTGLSGTTGIPNASPSVTTTYTVIGNLNNCRDTQLVTVIVNSNPIASINGITAICGGQQASLTASGGSLYLWSNGQTTDVISPATAGTYSVTVTNSGGCTGMATAVVTLNSLPLNFPRTYYICEAGSVTLSASGGTFYSWSPATGLSCTSCPNPIASPFVNTVYTVTVTNGGCTDTAQVSVIFAPTPPVPIITIIGGDTLICSHASAYQWYLNGNLISGATDSAYVALQDGSYNVGITDSLGCTRLGNPIYVVISSIKELTGHSNISIYPNPADEEIVVAGYGLYGRISIQIHDVLGQIIYSSDEKGLSIFTKKIDLSKFAKGIYFVLVKDEKNKWLNKLILE